MLFDAQFSSPTLLYINLCVAITSVFYFFWIFSELPYHSPNAGIGFSCVDQETNTN